MTPTTPRLRARAAACLAAALAISCVTAMAQTATPLLFKIVTVRDEILVAVPPDEARAPRPEAAAIGQALAAKGALSLWQYAPRKGTDGALELAPRARISVLAHDSLRVEPYPPALRVVPVP
ncbi:hypothetical protein GmRootA79_25800 [Acidovorax sp. A79]|uniref:hypothetical protein n=1 Tax=Acidovorax sp. A79 TaxID=3056107 RepID=UPI0034E8FD32